MVFLVLLTINKKIAVKYIPLHASHTQAKFAVRNNWNWKTATGAGVRTRMNESSTYHKKRVKVESKKLYLIDHKGLGHFLKSHLKFHLNAKPFRSFGHILSAFPFVYNKANFMEATRHIGPCKVYSSLGPMGSYAPAFYKMFSKSIGFPRLIFSWNRVGEYRSKNSTTKRLWSHFCDKVRTTIELTNIWHLWQEQSVSYRSTTLNNVVTQSF